MWRYFFTVFWLGMGLAWWKLHCQGKPRQWPTRIAAWIAAWSVLMAGGVFFGQDHGMSVPVIPWWIFWPYMALMVVHMGVNVWQHRRDRRRLESEGESLVALHAALQALEPDLQTMNLVLKGRDCPDCRSRALYAERRNGTYYTQCRICDYVSVLL